MADANYERGEMDIDGHEETFGGFMSYSMYGGAAIILVLLLPILMFAVNLSWFMSLIATVILGVLVGVIMRFKAQYYAVLIGLAVLFFIIAALSDLIFF